MANNTRFDHLDDAVRQIEQGLSIIVNKFHCIRCEIDPALLDQKDKQLRHQRLVLIETIIGLLAEHASADLHTFIRCKGCRRAVAERVSNCTIHGLSRHGGATLEALKILEDVTLDCKKRHIDTPAVREALDVLDRYGKLAFTMRDILTLNLKLIEYYEHVDAVLQRPSPDIPEQSRRIGQLLRHS